MNKGIAALLASAALFSLLTGCSARPLPDGVDQDAAGEAGKAIVALLVERNYQGVVDSFDPTMRESIGLTAEMVESSIAHVLDAGAYLNTYQVMVVGGQSKGYEGDFITVGIYCEHEDVDIIYEMSFDTDLELIGLDAKQKHKALFG